MLQYIHEGHQGKERCLLRARNTVFWPKITYDIQKLIERCIICQEHGKSQSIIGTSQELPPFPWHTLATDIFYWKRMDFLIVADVSSIYHRHIEHFFAFFAGNTVFSLVSESPCRLYFLSLARMGELPPRVFMSNDGTGH